MKNKFKSYTFWLALIGAVIILVNTLGTTFGFSVNEVAITSIATAVLGIFVTLGIVRKDNKTEQKSKDKQPNEQELKNLEEQKDENGSEDEQNKTDEDKKG